jgi:hypothetical protein
VVQAFFVRNRTVWTMNDSNSNSSNSSWTAADVASVLTNMTIMESTEKLVQVSHINFCLLL